MKIQFIVSLFLIAALCLADGYSQEKTANKKEIISESIKLQKNPGSENQCAKYGTEHFVGKRITKEFTDENVQEVLKFFSEQCNGGIIIDKSVKQLLITAKITNIPWNVALDVILKSKDLGIQVNGPVLRVADVKTLEQERGRRVTVCTLGTVDKLYTESIKIKNALCCACIHNICKQEITLDILHKIIARRLTNRGKIEIDEDSHTLFVTDVKDSIDAIKALVELLDSGNLHQDLKKAEKKN